MKRRNFLKNTTSAGFITVITPAGLLFSYKEGSMADPLEESFQNPPASAKPMTWWHWINGNVSKEGITRDLEAMAEVGIGGFQAFSAYMDMPIGPADYLSPLWIELMQHAADEALRLGLEFDLHNCMGWSSSGGSWVPPELSMQQVVWSEAFVEGGQKVQKQLEKPFTRMDYYRDAMVIAFPSPSGENAAEHAPRKITLHGNPVDTETISGIDLSSGLDVYLKEASKPSYLEYEFEKPVEVRSVTVNSSDMDGPVQGENLGNTMVLEASEDGKNFSKVAELSKLSNRLEIPAIAHFPLVKAKYFRLVIPMARHIANVGLSATESIAEWPYKAGYPNTGYYPEIELDLSASDKGFSEAAINPDEVIDISEYMNAEGILEWEAPTGYWTILRFGHTTTGATNRPAEGKGKGLEIDKFSSAALDFHFNYMLDRLLPVLKPLAAKGKLGMLVDSYEVNLQNWTKDLPKEFKARRAYDILNYLPVLTGRAVGSKNTAERFLWDFRKTCAEVMVDNYQDRFVQLCEENNIISYTEPYNRSPFDQMEAGAKMDINMGEFWLRTGHFSQSLKVAASIQNMNGRQIVGAESFTGRPYYSKWQSYPFSMKAQGDFMFTEGLNRFIFHRYCHQPHPTAAPGMTMGQWGFHFERTNTWFYQGKKWLEYAARCQFLLQQGIFVGDVLCYTGEEAPGDDISMGALRPEIPAGFDWQFVNTEVLLNRISIKDGKIMLPDGMTFRLLVLPDKNFMTLKTLRRLKELVGQGMLLSGPRPESLPTLSNFAEAQREFKDAVEELWGAANTDSVERKVGIGTVYANLSISEVLERMELKPDFNFTSKSGDAPINYIHRKLDDGHVYFVANRRRRAEDIVCRFRVSGFKPELWDADTGERIAFPIYDIGDGVTTVPLHLNPSGTVFVIFRSPVSTDRLRSIAHDDKIVMSTENIQIDREKFNEQLTDDFSVGLWVKPETDELLPKGLGDFSETTRYISSYPIYAPSGEQLYGKGHASLCLAVARNGIAVFEKEEDNVLNTVVLAPMPISSWTSIVVVYEAGTPTLYIDGKLIEKGKQSDKIVHPVMGKHYENEKMFYYDGDASTPEVFETSLSAGEVSEWSANGMRQQNEPVKLEFVQGPSTALRIWENGKYTLTDTSGIEKPLKISGLDAPITLSGEWKVQFPPDLGAPDEILLSKLKSLHTHSEDGVKYFSGTATYSRNFKVTSKMTSNGKKLFLDLGRIAVIAEVKVNGKELGIVWKPPYRLEITDDVQKGENTLEVQVTNLWPNRLIGDEQLPAENEYKEYGPKGSGIVDLPAWYRNGEPKPKSGRIGFSTWKHFDKQSPLLESGLIGPVVLRSAVVKSMANK